MSYSSVLEAHIEVLQGLQKVSAYTEDMFNPDEIDLQLTRHQERVIEEIVNKFFPDQIIVRSSAIGEDSSESSEAGKYKSIQKISTKNKRKIEDAIKDVIETYSQQKNENELNQILIQKQTTGVISNGVVFTKTPDNGSPYYVVNFSDSSHTDDVTKGEISNLIYIFREIEEKEIPKKWKQLIACIKEIESIFRSDYGNIS